MALTAESLSAGVTFPTIAQPQVSPYSIANNFLPDSSQQFPVVESHILGILDARFILGIGPLEEDLWGRRTSGGDTTNH
jgi:hypothetical protein